MYISNQHNLGRHADLDMLYQQITTYIISKKYLSTTIS